ncbi:hypothetical protein C0Z10_11515 [Acidipropionibacterium jensenii]|uniref:Uncharacterized protein n=1 Tax=Acidipropionibacterium jensenii TaxID=1749 RepID=A0A3Q9UFF1_9ACTN|nr:hypothetical protein C0Z10_11515 [Acidipropionibacterium jensenii]
MEQIDRVQGTIRSSRSRGNEIEEVVDDRPGELCRQILQAASPTAIRIHPANTAPHAEIGCPAESFPWNSRSSDTSQVTHL